MESLAISHDIVTIGVGLGVGVGVGVGPGSDPPLTPIVITTATAIRAITSATGTIFLDRPLLVGGCQ